MQIRFRYNYLKKLILHYRKISEPSPLKRQNVKSAVKEEIRKLRYINKISNNYEKRNIISQIVFENNVDVAFNDKRHLLRYNQLYNHRRVRNKIQREISDSVREFMKEKLLKQRIEKENKN
tara:strand:+ start:332 stop:694 length:363 start_codon:yes stop_codon:yes gene_type:complete